MQRFFEKAPLDHPGGGGRHPDPHRGARRLGVFQGPVRAEYGFDEAAASFVLSLTIGAYGLGCVLGGFLQDKAGPRIAGFAGTALLAAGFFAVGFVPAGKPGLFYLAFSLPVGLGSAFCTRR